MFKSNIKIIVAFVWAVLATVFGLFFIKNNYYIGMENQYNIQVGRAAQTFWLIVAIIVAWIIIFGFVRFLSNAILINTSFERKIFVYSLPFLIVISYFFVRYYLNSYYFVGDEKNIWDAAVRLYPYFFVYTSEIYLVTFFILPISIAPVIVKIVLESIIMGYVIYRFYNHYRNKMVFLLYAFCLAPPFWSMSVEVHRMHWYGFVYLFVTVKLFFDADEKCSKIKNTIYYLWVVALMALLTVWRREGIYLFVFGALLLWVAYLHGADKRQAVRRIALFFAVEFLFYVPVVLDGGVKEKGTEVDAILVHALGEDSFDKTKVNEELSIIDKYVDVSIIDLYNQEMGDDGFAMNWFDEPAFEEGKYFIQREKKEVSYEEYSRAVFLIMEKEPVVFIKSRIRAFKLTGNSRKSYNLFAPLGIILACLLRGIIKKDKAMSLIMLGVFVHVSITAMTMPASFFKYFLHMWLVAYEFVIVLVMDGYELLNARFLRGRRVQ